MKMPHEKTVSHLSRDHHPATVGGVLHGDTVSVVCTPHHYRIEAFIIALALIFATALGCLPSLSRWVQQDNTLTLSDGAVRLGTVYSERITSQLIISRVIDNSELLRVEADPEHLYAVAVERVLHNIRQINDQAKASQGNSFTPVLFDSAMWNDDIRVRLITSIEYQSEYHHPYRFTMASSDRIVKKDKATIKPILDSIQSYGVAQLAQYRAQYSFIPQGKP
jgi:hypothetical protein